MVNLSAGAKSYITGNKKLIDSGDFDSFINQCYSYWRKASWNLNEYSEILNFLYNDCGIDFLQYMTSLLVPLTGLETDTLIIPENITKISTSFEGKLYVKHLIFNANVRFLPDGIFSQLSNIKSIEINSPNLTRLPQESFRSDYHLEKIYLNSPIKSIGVKSIDYCDQLKAIVCNKDVQLRVPSYELEKYRPVLKAKKVKVQESLVLTEAYSSSMPGWLKSWLNQPQCERYKKRLIDYWGLDLSKAKFISVAPSALKKSQENRVKSPNIAFWDLSAVTTQATSMVCAKGVNDENCGIWNISDHYFKYWPLKLLVANASNFCYVDTSDPENLYDKVQRNNNRIEREERWIKGIERVPGNVKMNSSVASIDKSGYVIRRAADKFADALKEAKAKNYQKTLDKIKSQLLEYKDYIVSEMGDILSEQNRNHLDMEGDLSYFTRILDDYTYLVREFDSQSNKVLSLANQYGGQELLKKMGQYFDSYEWGAFVSKLNNFKTNYIPQLVDWQLPEYDEED